MLLTSVFRHGGKHSNDHSLSYAGVYGRKAAWPRGEAKVCKTFYAGSNPAAASFY